MKIQTYQIQNFSVKNTKLEQFINGNGLTLFVIKSKLGTFRGPFCLICILNKERSHLQ